MSEWWKIWANGLPNGGRSPKSGHRMAAKGMQFHWRWFSGTISTNLDVIWGMSEHMSSRFDAAIALIDDANAQDPNMISTDDGKYGQMAFQTEAAQ